MASRFSNSQRSCSSCVSSKRRSTSSTVAEPVAWSCFWILASRAASRISMFIAGSLGDDEGLGLFKRGNRSSARDRRKITEELIKCLAALQIVEQRLKGHASPCENRHSAKNLGVFDD